MLGRNKLIGQYCTEERLCAQPHVFMAAKFQTHPEVAGMPEGAHHDTLAARDYPRGRLCVRSGAGTGSAVYKETAVLRARRPPFAKIDVGAVFRKHYNSESAPSQLVDFGTGARRIPFVIRDASETVRSVVIARLRIVRTHLAWVLARLDVVSVPPVASIALPTKPEATHIARTIRVLAPSSVIGLPSSIPG